MMRCSLEGCGGEYEARKVIHAVRHRGQIVVIDGAPAEVCNRCGDALLRPETVRRLEAPLAHEPAAVRSAPLYEYA